MRTREQQLDPTTQYSESACVYRANGSESDIFRSSGFSEFTGKQRMIDQVNPGYFKAEREGGLKPVSPMLKITNKVVVIPASCSGTLNWEGTTFTQNYNFVGIAGGMEGLMAQVSPPVPPDVDPNITLQAALASAQTDAWDTATFLAEFGKTVEMFTSFRGRVMQHYTKVVELGDRIYTRRNMGKLLFSYADAFSEAWLTLRYGLRPLYYDAMSIQRAVGRLSEGIDSPLARGWATGNVATSSSLVKSTTVNGWSTPFGGGSTGGTKMRMSAYKEISVQSRATVGVRVSTRVATMFDMAVTSWEMMPWSFILDWFITVGDAIAAFSPFATGTMEYNTHTFTTTETEVFTFRPILTPYGEWRGSATGTEGSVTRFRETYNRTVDAEIKPTLAWNLNIDALKILDLLTIVYSLKAGILKRLAFRR